MKEKEKTKKDGERGIHEASERIPSLPSAIRSSVEEEPAPLMAAEAILLSPALLLPLLHLPHLLHREGDRLHLLQHHGLQERLRSRAARLAADPALRGQVLREGPLLRLRLEWEPERQDRIHRRPHHGQ